MEFLSKLFICVIVTAVAGIPAWIYLLARSVFEPGGFWQNLILFGFGLYFLGFIQLVLFVVWVALIIFIMKSD